MPRSKVSDKQREEIVSSRQRGENWSEIGKKMGLDRRIIKNVYDNWERNSSVEGLQVVRKEVAESEFKTHMESIVNLAVSLVSNLDVPSSINDMKNSEEFFTWFFKQDLLQRYTTSEFQSELETSAVGQKFNFKDSRIDLDEKKLLFKSLREHTRREVNWNFLDNDWTNARDNCAITVPQLFKDTRELVENYFKIASDPGFLKKVKGATHEKDPVKNVTQKIVNEIWLTILNNKQLENIRFEAISKDINSVDVVIKLNEIEDGALLRLMSSDRKYLADNITRQCNSAIQILMGETSVQKLFAEVGYIRTASDTLREMLNPLKLCPMILRTRCDLCPV